MHRPHQFYCQLRTWTIKINYIISQTILPFEFNPQFFCSQLLPQNLLIFGLFISQTPSSVDHLSSIKNRNVLHIPLSYYRRGVRGEVFVILIM